MPSHHEYFQSNNRRFRNPQFRAKMTAEFPIFPFLNRSFTNKRVRYFQQLIPDYCYYRQTLSLSEEEISKVFHLSDRSVKILLKRLKDDIIKFQPRRFSDSGVRYVFRETLQRLKQEIARCQTKGELMTLNELKISCPTLFNFVNGKRINVMIIEQQLDEVQFKFSIGEVAGVKICGRKV